MTSQHSAVMCNRPYIIVSKQIILELSRSFSLGTILLELCSLFGDNLMQMAVYDTCY